MQLKQLENNPAIPASCTACYLVLDGLVTEFHPKLRFPWLKKVLIDFDLGMGSTFLGRKTLFDQIGPFDETLRQSFGLQLCAMQDAACVQDWQAKTGVAFEYLYLDKQRIRQNQGAASGPVYLQKSLLETNQYEIIYETPAVTILQARK